MDSISTEKNNALNQLVDEYTPELYSWALHKTSDSEVAADLVQETFLAAVEKWESFEGKSKPKTWLFGILKNKIIDHYRKKAKKAVRQEDVRDHIDDFDEKGHWTEEAGPKPWGTDDPLLIEDKEFNAIMQKCMDDLPEKWNSCLLLKYYEEKEAKLICQELEISTTNYWQILHRAKVQLRKCIDKNWFNT